MGCCGIKGGDKEEADDEKRMRKTNKEIEKQIQKDKQVRETGFSSLDLDLKCQPQMAE